MSKLMVRQGDVLLVQTSRQLPLFRDVAGKTGLVVLAQGEKTGHAHVVPASDACLEIRATEGGSQSWLLVHRPTQLTHEEHSAIALEPGEYQVVIQKQYNPIEHGLVQD